MNSLPKGLTPTGLTGRVHGENPAWMSRKPGKGLIMKQAVYYREKAEEILSASGNADWKVEITFVNPPPPWPCPEGITLSVTIPGVAKPQPIELCSRALKGANERMSAAQILRIEINNLIAKYS